MSDEESETFVYVLPESVSRQFITEYKRRPILWDPQNPLYSNKLSRIKAYDELLQVLLPTCPNATRDMVRKQINTLRTNYKKCLRKYLNSKVIIDGEEVYQYIPTNWKFHALRFLDNVFKFSETDIKMEEGLEYATISTPGEEHEVTYKKKKYPQFEIKYVHDNKRKKKYEDSSYEPEEFEYDNRHDNTSNEEFDAVGANVALKLKRMALDQRYHAELLINKILINGLKNKLNDDTDLSGLTIEEVVTYETVENTLDEVTGQHHGSVNN